MIHFSKILSGAFLFLGGMAHAEERLLEVTPSFKSFVSEYCLDCHNVNKSKGDRAFDKLIDVSDGKLTVNIDDKDKLWDLKDILDQLNLGEMPPEKKEVKHPSSEMNREIRNWLTSELLKLEEESKVVEARLRRLNKVEVKNSLESLLGLDHISFDPCKNFPEDENHHGFVNQGKYLSLNDKHFKDMLDISETYLDMALHFGPVPETKEINVTPKMWGLKNRIENSVSMYRIRKGNKYIDIGAGQKLLTEYLALGSVPRSFYRDESSIQSSGYYEIEVEAEAIRRLTHPYDPAMIPANLNQAMQLSLFIAENKNGTNINGDQFRKKVGLWDLLDHEKKTFKAKVWMKKGSIPFLNWDNGPGHSVAWMRDVVKKYHTDIELKGKQGAHAFHIIGKDLVPGRVLSDVWKGPVMRIHKLKVTGPLPESFTTRAQMEYFGGERNINKVDIQSVLQKFMTQAYRRPVAKDEVVPFYALAQEAISKKKSRKDGLYNALKAVLVSPEFLYHRMETDDSGRLDALSIANRLSYTLWSTVPDSRLYDLANQRKLLDQTIQKQEIQRMLKDPKSDQFVKGFVQSWLRLDKLGLMAPDATKYYNYYKEGLEEAMRTETELFVKDHLEHNLPVLNLLNSQETFVNQSLAKHYGMDDVKGVHFRKVKLGDSNHRGGILGHASVLTLTSNGVETSPVTRGIWVLESILGITPPPPPPDVEALDPDIRGAVTLKERLRKHREVESCADCHAKIDPYGFPLELYSPIGEYRPNYFRTRVWNRQKNTLRANTAKKVDAKSKLPSGEKVATLSELRESLIKKKDKFSKMLVEKLLIYATGREMTFKDNAEIESLARRKPPELYGFRDMVVDVLTSDISLKP